MRTVVSPELVAADKPTPGKDIDIHVIDRNGKEVRVDGMHVQVQHDLLLRREHVLDLSDMHVQQRLCHPDNEGGGAADQKQRQQSDEDAAAPSREAASSALLDILHLPETGAVGSPAVTAAVDPNGTHQGRPLIVSALAVKVVAVVISSLLGIAHGPIILEVSGASMSTLSQTISDIMSRGSGML